MRPGFWQALAVKALRPATLGEWRELAGADFAALRTFLVSTHAVAQRCPCGNKKDCGCQHKVEARTDAGFFSVCQCKVGNCQTAKLSLDEATLFELDVKRLVGALCRVLKLSLAVNGVGHYGGERLRLVGTYGVREWQVYVALCTNEADLLECLKQVASWGSKPFIVLAPTAGVRSKAMELFLEEQRSVFIPLAPCVAVDGSGEFRMTSSIDKVMTQLAGETGGEAKPATRKSFGSCGRLRYENDFSDTWLGDEHFDLRKYAKARLCLEYLVENGAYSVKSARHFLEEIDPYVREKGDFIKLSGIRIVDYFKDPSGRLAKLRQGLVVAVGGNGKYYLKTGAA